jgi:hypothetical protein
MAPRAVTERQVIALNEMYSLALAAEQLTGGNDLNIDVEGSTIYVENTPTRMCFTDVTTGFWVEGVNLLDGQCVTGLENHRGKRYVAETDGVFKAGAIENAAFGWTLIANECIGNTGTISVTYQPPPIGQQGNPLNIRTVFRQNGIDTVVIGEQPEFVGTCDETAITSSAFGNQERDLYRRSITVF